MSDIRIWNYNGSVDMSYAGVRHARLSLDGAALRSRLLLLRRAPGHLAYDFVHQLDLASLDDR